MSTDLTLFTEAGVDDEGELVGLDWLWLAKALLRFAGKRVIVRVQLWTEKRSLAANNYYWAVVVEALHERSGFDKLYCHNWLKSKFNCEVALMVNEHGEFVEQLVPLSTKNLSKQDFANYLDQCEAWIADFFNYQFQPYSGDRYAYYEEAA